MSQENVLRVEDRTQQQTCFNWFIRYVASDGTGEYTMTTVPVRYYAYLVITMVLWGGSWVAKDIAMMFASPFVVGFLRMLVASILFLVFMPLTGKRPHRRYRRSDIRILLVVGVVGVFGYEIVELAGVGLSTAAHGAIIDGAQPMMMALVAHLILRERLDRRWKYVGLLFSLVGVLLVVGVQSVLEFQPEYFLGDLILILGAFMWSLYSSLGKVAMRTIRPMEMTAGGVMIGTVLLAIGAAAENFWTLPAMWEPLFWITVLYLGGMSAFVCFVLYFMSMEKVGATRTGVFISIIPVTGTILSALIMNEPLYWTIISGMVLVALGIIVTNVPVRSHREENTTA